MLLMDGVSSISCCGDNVVDQQNEMGFETKDERVL